MFECMQTFCLNNNKYVLNLQENKYVLYVSYIGIILKKLIKKSIKNKI